MALGAGDLLWRRLMGEAFDVSVAIDAREHGAVCGMLELSRIDKQAVRLSVDVH
jgi:hypothetical protein